jgi:hypothetical protein
MASLLTPRCPGASQNVVLIKRFVSNLIFNLPKSLQRRDFHILQVPPLEGFREVKVDKRQNEMHPRCPQFTPRTRGELGVNWGKLGREKFYNLRRVALLKCVVIFVTLLST